MKNRLGEQTTDLKIARTLRARLHAECRTRWKASSEHAQCTGVKYTHVLVRVVHWLRGL